MKYGLESEFFVTYNGEIQVMNKWPLPADECGVLAEARGKCENDILHAVFALKAEIFRMQKIAEEKGLIMFNDPSFLKIDRKVRLEAMRHFDKGRIHYENIYGHDHHKTGQGVIHCGLHISFTQQKEIETKDRIITINELFDFVKIIRRLDKAFAQEIKEAKRMPGFYEIKNDKRIEYRSLPANVNLDKVIFEVEKATTGVY